MNNNLNKLCYLKERILSEKKLIQTVNGVVYRSHEARGEQVIHVKLDLATASHPDSPAELNMTVPDLCFGYLRYLVAKAKMDRYGQDAQAVCQIQVDLLTAIRKSKSDVVKARSNLKKLTKSLAQSTATLAANELLYAGCNDDKFIDQLKNRIERLKCKIEARSLQIPPATAAFTEVEAQSFNVFSNATDITEFFKTNLGWTLGSTSLFRISKVGVENMGTKGRPQELSREAENDLIAVIQFASDNGVTIPCKELSSLATAVRDAERKAENKPPRTSSFSEYWSIKCQKKNAKRAISLASNLGHIATATEARNNDTEADCHNTGANSVPLGASSTRRRGGTGDEMNASSGGAHLSNVIIELARENEVCQGRVRSIVERRVEQQREKDEHRRQQIMDEMAALQEELDTLNGNIGRARNRVQEAVYPVKRKLKSEKKMLDGAFRTLNQDPSDDMFRRVASQVDSIKGAERDEYGAMVAPLSGALVALRPVLASTLPDVRILFEEALNMSGPDSERAIIANMSRADRRNKRRRKATATSRHEET